MKLNHDIAVEWWMDHLAGNLQKDKKAILDEYLEVHKTLANELQDTETYWLNMEALNTPEPSTVMDQRFDAMLAGYQQATPGSGFQWSIILSWFKQNWQVGLSAMAVGILIGVFIINGTDKDVKSLNTEVQDMKKLLMLTMIEQPQAQERIKAVSLTSELPAVDTKVTDALISTLNHDQSINVRLAALEALVAYGDQIKVRTALIRSIATQQSPLMQVALADAMIMLREKSALKPFEQLLESDEVNDSVKSKLKSTIETLQSI